MDSILKCYIDIPFDCGSVHIRLIGVRIHVISTVETKEKIWQRAHVKLFNKTSCWREFCVIYTLARIAKMQHGEIEMALRALLGVVQRLII